MGVNTGLIEYCQNAPPAQASQPHGNINGWNIYMFDVDGTLVTTQSGNKFPKSSKDWKWIDHAVIKKLRKVVLTDDRAVIVLISNQKVASSNETRKKLVKGKLVGIFNALISELPDKARVCLFGATRADRYRKPSTGVFEDHVENMIGPDTRKLIFVGDAAGRANDFSDSDRKFAYNIQLYLVYKGIDTQIKFFTPEQYFDIGTGSGSSAKRGAWSGFNPRAHLNAKPVHTPAHNEAMNRVHDARGFTLIVLVGPQATGKSTYAKREFPEYHYFGLDELPRRPNYDKLFNEHIEIARKKSKTEACYGVVVDATNASIIHRDRWLKHHEFENMFILVFPGSDPHTREDHAEYIQHMNVVRSRISKIDMIPDVAYRTFYKNYQHPRDDEFPGNLSGKSEIIHIPSVDMTFDNKKKYMYYMQLS